MNKYEKNKSHAERRADSRNTLGKYYSVELLLNELDVAYQFKLWDLSVNGMCVLVKEDSNVIKHVNVGDILDLKYHPAEEVNSVELLKTEVKHITKDDQGRFKGHYMVGLSILEKQDI